MSLIEGWPTSDCRSPVYIYRGVNHSSRDGFGIVSLRLFNYSEVYLGILKQLQVYRAILNRKTNL